MPEQVAHLNSLLSDITFNCIFCLPIVCTEYMGSSLYITLFYFLNPLPLWYHTIGM
uniref:Uncharacterized protein n=1 Tax=Octopus bimaculoides TaxID=37653 RepID=A0A0L8H4F5_OCTBM